MSTKLKTLDFIVKRKLEAPHSTPIVGLVDIDDVDVWKELFAEFLDRDARNLEGAFKAFPFASAWIIASVLRTQYGVDENHAVYAPLERVLKVRLEVNGAGRRLLRQGFNQVCRKIGVATGGFERNVDLYLAQAGVPEGMLDHLAAAFLRQERHFGTPPLENTRELNEWEDQALELLPPGIQSPRYAVQLDQTGWHAALFAEIRHGRPGRDDRFREAFRTAIERQKERLSAGGWTATVPRPRLRWDDDALALDVPPIEGRLRVSTATDQFRLAGRRMWRVPQPWPQSMQWEVGEARGEIRFLSDPQAIAVFDRQTGRFLKEVTDGGAREKLDALEIVVLAREPFSIGGEAAFQIGDGAYARFHSLTVSGAVVEVATKRLNLALRPLRRITPICGVVANGPHGALQGADTEFRIETGFAVDEQRTIRLLGAGREARVAVEFVAGVAQLSLTTIGTALGEAANTPLGSDPFRLRMELPVIQSSASGVGAVFVASFWVWPGARQSLDRMAIETLSLPSNLSLERCRHIDVGSQGQIYLEGQGGYARARLAFEIDHQFVEFDVAYPDVTCVRQMLDGREQFLPLGASIVLRPDERFDSISIHCPDPEADLVIRSHKELKPFRQTSRRNISLRDLLYAGGDERVMLRRGTGSEVELFRVVEAISPRRFETRTKHRVLNLTLEMPDPIDAIALDVEDDFGARSHEEVALGYRPVEKRPPGWLEAEIASDAPSQVKVRIALSAMNMGLHLARVSVRSPGSSTWKRIENARGDVFALALEGAAYDTEVGLSRRFQTLTRWMTLCYSQQSWDQVGNVLPRHWKVLGRRLSELPGGGADLLVASMFGPPEDASPSWVPVAHPLVFLPELYGAPASQFAALAASEDNGAVALAIVSDLTASNLHQKELLDTTALLAFQNAASAHKTGEPLRGFSSRKFFEWLVHPHVDGDAGAGALWRGKPLLGPAHWRAAHLRLEERLEAAGLFGDEEAEAKTPNGLRQIGLQKLMQACHRRCELTPPVPKRDPADEEPNILDQWASATLSGFAAAARGCSVSSWARKLAEEIGCSIEDVLRDLSFLLRLAPELFAFHMGLAELNRAEPGKLHA